MANNPDDTGWRAPTVISTPGGPAGVVQMASATEAKPCFTCKRWHKDNRKLMQFIKAHGLTPDQNGIYTLRIPELPNRQSIAVDPKDWGFCLSLAMPTHMNATCDNWRARETAADMEGLVK